MKGAASIVVEKMEIATESWNNSAFGEDQEDVVEFDRWKQSDSCGITKYLPLQYRNIPRRPPHSQNVGSGTAR